VFSCRDVNDKADLLAGHKLSPLDRLQLHLHLLICRNCRHFINQFEQTRQILSSRQWLQHDADAEAEIIKKFSHFFVKRDI